MKPSDDNQPWSEEAVDELLTAFFQAEVPARLQGTMPPGLIAQPRVEPTIAIRPAAAETAASVRGKTAALLCCAAALVMVVGLALRFNDNPTPGHGTIATPNVDTTDEPINVNAREIDDFNAPEQNIEILDDAKKK